MKQRVILFAMIAAIALLLSPLLVNIANAPTDPYWFDTSWHFRIALAINNTDYARDNWPIEHDMNFTALITQTGKSGTFDYNSIRIYAHNSTGGVMHPMKYQFDNASDSSAASNAAGTLVFLLNGTTAANEIRYFYVYFDTIENGAKSPPSFSTNLNYSWDGKEAHVNNSMLRWKIDTMRNENTSGLYDAKGNSATIFTQATSNRTIEYIQYSNGTNNFSFDFRNNATFISGPIMLRLEQAGNEMLWNNPDAITGAGWMKKTYVFYENTKWLKIIQNFTNIGGSSITRNSTNGGALSVNELIDNSLLPPFGNESNPMSRYGASDGSRGVGIINVNSSSNANYSAVYDAALDRIGINLNSTTLAPQESIIQTTVMQFDDVQYSDDQNLLPLRNQLLYPPIITQDNPQYITFMLESKTNYTIHNRNESVLITGNTTFDPYNISSSMNATLDMGTADSADDITIVLYDDGSAEHGDATASDTIFSNYFNLSEDSVFGTWNITINAYDISDILLNQSITAFNVTNEYSTSINISNPDGFVDRIINTTLNVKNKRYDTFIPGATLNCSYSGSGELTNITDYGNGTYLLNFTAPSITGSYLLNCSAIKFNNTGWAAQWFYTETSETMLLLNITPENHTTSNITRATGNSFIINLNATDIGGANAKYTNMTLSLPQNITANATNASCGTVIMGTSCLRDFNITIANGTSPGNYTLNTSVVWENPDTSKNTTNSSVTIYVLSNPQINITPANISGNAPDGKTVTIGTFTVWSIGNDNITNTTFNVTGIPDFSVSFSPQNISGLAAGSSQPVSVNVTVPSDYAPGNYTGTINASTINDGWKTIELNVAVPSTTNLSINITPQNYTSRNISYSNSESFNITINTSNTGVTGAKDVNISLSLPQNLSANSTIENCGNISTNSFCINQFNITISNQTAPGNYTFNITATWKNPDLSINSTTTNMTVAVLSNPLLNVSEGGISTILFDNTTAYAGNFTTYSLGNDNLTNITFNVTGLSNFTFTFLPANISTLGVNSSQLVSVNVSVPFAYSPGNYTGTINMSSINDGWKVIEINVSVLIRREWSISPTHCERAENPDTGTVCSVAVSNTGNAPINFTVNPSGINYTSANETNFTVAKNSTHSLVFLYNVSNITKDFFYSFYTINATDADASPQYSNFNITLIPYVIPLFSVNVLPNETEQRKNVEIMVNVTDRSTTGINWTQMNITLPNGTLETHNLTRIDVNGTFSQWYFNYSGIMNISNLTNMSGNLSNITLNYTGSTALR
ncbi:MAG: hypothetical protein KKE71_00275, partial [Nanoarchaeota archaeon]|nr:hypothetical protein [Nanoarchaeota archaeon]